MYAQLLLMGKIGPGSICGVFLFYIQENSEFLKWFKWAPIRYPPPGSSMVSLYFSFFCFACVIEYGGWKNDSQKFANNSHFGQGAVGRELSLQTDGQLWELAIT
jgi:hypothetical protein